MANQNTSLNPVKKTNEEFMLYPTKLFNETDDDEFKRGTSAIASHNYMRGLVMGTCDKFAHPVVILQRNSNWENGKKCENCGKDENTAFCSCGRFLRLESTLFYDHWAKVCKKIREKGKKIQCCQRDEIVADFLLNNLNSDDKTHVKIDLHGEKIDASITKSDHKNPHICIRYECPVSHYDELAVNINVNGIQGVMIIGQLLFSNTSDVQINEFRNTAQKLKYKNEEINLLIDGAKVKKKNFIDKNTNLEKDEKNKTGEVMSAKETIDELFNCIEALEKSLEKEFVFKTDINVKELQEKMIKTFNDYYKQKEEIEKENIDNVKKCEKKYELLKTAFLASLKEFCEATMSVTELYSSVPKGLYFNSENDIARIKGDIIGDYKQFFKMPPKTIKDEFVSIGNGYYEFCKRLDVIEEKYVRIIMKTDMINEANKIFSGFLQFVCLYITELFAQYNGAQMSEYTKIMRHEMGQLNEAVLIRINTFQEAVEKQDEDYYTYSFITECNHVIEDYKSHAHSTMLRCNSSRYFTQLPDVNKELFYPYESFLYKWRYIYEKAARSKNVDFNMMPVQFFDLSRPRMYADKSMIEQVAYNLTNNAIKYSIPGTIISIDCKLNDRKDAYQFIVTNYGRSLTDEEIDKIFDYGYRGSNNNEANGSGLGLYLSREIAKAHGGSLTVITEKVSDYDVSCLYLYSEMPEKFQNFEMGEIIIEELSRIEKTKYSLEIKKPNFNNQSFTPYLIRRYLSTGTTKYSFVLSIPYEKNLR